MKILWTGTDALMLVDRSRRSIRKRIIWSIFAMVIRFMDEFFVEAHYVDSQNLADRLNSFGVKKHISVQADVIKHNEKYEKKPHKGFNVLYYMPKKGTEVEFWRWVYGYDIFERLKKEMPHINFIVVDGSADMEEIFPVVDFYLRPNRSDGASRLRQECDIQGIPYYWTQENPKYVDAKKAIESEFAKIA